MAIRFRQGERAGVPTRHTADTAVLPPVRRAQRLTISVFGLVVGSAGLEHGIGEIAQGGRVPDGLAIESWAGSELFELLSGEPAMTLVPNLLVTGIIAVLVSIAFLAWATFFIDREHAGLVLAGLSLLLLLFGGGFAPPILGIILSVAAGRMHADRVPRASPSATTRLLSKVWPWSLGAGLVAWLAIFPGTVIVAALFGPAGTAAIEGGVGAVILAFLALLVFSLVAASARDGARRAQPLGAGA